MNTATPIDGVIIQSECTHCWLPIVWSQHDNRWVHQRTYTQHCPDNKGKQ